MTAHEKSPTAALRINVNPYDDIVIEPQEIDGTGHDFAVIVTYTCTARCG